MKKMLLNTARILLVLSCAFFWASCDNNGEVENSDLVGTWSFVDSEDTETTFILNKNGTFSISTKGGDENFTEKGTWTFNDPALTLRYEDGDVFNLTVVSVSSTKLVISDENEGETYTTTFSKVNSGKPDEEPGNNSDIVGT